MKMAIRAIVILCLLAGLWVGAMWLHRQNLSGPMTARVDTNVKGRVVNFRFVVEDESGNTSTAIRLPGGRQPGAPTVTILGPEGEPVYRFRMRYG